MFPSLLIAPNRRHPSHQCRAKPKALQKLKEGERSVNLVQEPPEEEQELTRLLLGLKAEDEQQKNL